MDNKIYSLRPKPVRKLDKKDTPKPTKVMIPQAPEMSILLPSTQDLARSAFLKFKNALIAQKKNTIDPLNQLPPSREVPRFNRPPVIQPNPQAINTTPIARPTPRPVPVLNTQPIMQPKNRPTVSVKQYQDDNKLVTETTCRR